MTVYPWMGVDAGLAAGVQSDRSGIRSEGSVLEGR